MVLAVVISPANDGLRNGYPTFRERSFTEEKEPIFFSRPIPLYYHRIQLVVPALSYLLPTPITAVLGKEIPVLGSILRDQLDKIDVFLLAPHPGLLLGLLCWLRR